MRELLVVEDSSPGLFEALRTATERVRVSTIRQALREIIDLLAALRAQRIGGSLFDDPSHPEVGANFRALLRTITADERDPATDEVVLAMTFAISGDEERAYAHLATLDGLP